MAAGGVAAQVGGNAEPPTARLKRNWLGFLNVTATY